MFLAGMVAARPLNPGMADRPRIVIASPHVAECEFLADWLAADGFEPVKRSSPRAAVDEIQANAFDLLVADFAFAFRDGLYAASRPRNPKTPTVVIGESDPAAQAQAEGRGAMYLERPVGRAMLVCTVSMAIMDGRPVRCSTRKAVNRVDAVVDGVPSYIIDVSNEGLRLEISSNRRSSPPLYLSVHVPMIGVGLMVQRRWTSTRPGNPRTDVAWCGGVLARNQPKAEQAWRALVDMVPADGSRLRPGPRC